MYDLKDLPAFIFLVKGVRPDVFTNWETMLSSEINRRHADRDTGLRSQTSNSEFGSDMSGAASGAGAGMRSIDSIDTDIESMGFGTDSVSPLFSGDESQERLGAAHELSDAAMGVRGAAGEMFIRWPGSGRGRGSTPPASVPMPAQQAPQPVGPSFSKVLCSKHERLEQYVRAMNDSQVVEFAIHAGGRVAKLTEEKLQLQKTIRAKQQVVRRLQTRLDKEKQKALVAQSKQTDELNVERRGSRLTFKGSVALGIRKAMGLVSAASFPLASLIDSSRWTITRAEVHCWALLIARSRAFYATLFSLLSFVHAQHEKYRNTEEGNVPECGDVLLATDVGPAVQIPTGRIMTQNEAISLDCHLPIPTSLSNKDVFSTFTVGSTCFSGDATNASIWQREKLQGLETCTAFLVNVESLVKGDFKSAFVRFHQM